MLGGGGGGQRYGRESGREAAGIIVHIDIYYEHPEQSASRRTQ